jgi:hypothetical protein
MFKHLRPRHRVWNIVRGTGIGYAIVYMTNMRRKEWGIIERISSGPHVLVMPLTPRWCV